MAAEKIPSTFAAVEILLSVWYLTLLVLLVYYLVIFRYRRQHRIGLHKPGAGVSLIIPVKNDSMALQQHLPAMARQQYSPFEIIIVNDHSTKEECDRLEFLQKQFPQVTLLRADQPGGKKQALKLGAAHAKHPFLLFTDADCAPVSEHWISGMMAARTREPLVIGYSPYEKEHGLLNRMIRFETIMTAMQYLSWAWLGKPYMAVGRNMLIDKDVYRLVNPYESNLDIPYGDDDALIQAARKQFTVAAVADPDTFVVTQGAQSWKAWFNQKHRHLSAGWHYGASWWQPGVFGVTLVTHGLLTLAIVMGCFSSLFLVAWFIGLCVRWIVTGWWMRKLNDTSLIIMYPWLEVMYTVYLGGMGIYTLVNKRRTWN